jgi:hypothetical protein
VKGNMAALKFLKRRRRRMKYTNKNRETTQGSRRENGWRTSIYSARWEKKILIWFFPLFFFFYFFWCIPSFYCYISGQYKYIITELVVVIAVPGPTEYRYIYNKITNCIEPSA